MKVFFQKLFNLYAGEEKNAFLFASLGFLWSLAVTAGLKFADALFLIHIGAESLPQAYAMISCCMIVLASFLLYSFHSFSIHRIFLAVLCAGVLFYCFAYTCLSFDVGTQSRWLWFSLKIFGSLFFSVAVTCYWTFIDQYHHLQDAKRLYGLFSSMVFLGIAVTGSIMRSGTIDFKNLTLVIITLLAATCFWIAKIVRTCEPVHDEHGTEGSVGQDGYHIKETLHSILTSRFTLLLMAGNFITYLLLVITEFNYLSSFDSHFDAGHQVAVGNEENATLTQFLGQWLAVVSVSNLFIGLFLYSRLVRRWGIGNMLVCTPLILLFTFSGWSFSDSLVYAVIGMFVVEGTLYVVDDSNFNLLLNAVPSKLKYKIRISIESFFEPIGMLISSVLLSVPGLDSKFLGLALSVCALIVALLLKANYLKAIYKNLLHNALHFQRTLASWFSKMPEKEQKISEYRLLAILKNGNERDQIFALQGLIGFQDHSVLQKLLKHAEFIGSATKIKFIEFLSESPFATDAEVLKHLHQWSLETDDPSLQSAVYYYLAAEGLLHPEKAIRFLESHQLQLKAAAILSLKKSWAHLPPNASTLNRTLAAKHLQQLLDSCGEEEVSIGLEIIGIQGNPEDTEILLPFLKHPSLKIRRKAIASMAKIVDKTCVRHVHVLLDLLSSASDNESRLSCLEALGKMKDITRIRDIIAPSVYFRPNERRLTEKIISGMGLRTVPTLLAITKDACMHDRCRLLAGKILGRLALPQLRANLYDILSAEIERAYFYVYHYHTIQQNYPSLDLTLLEDALLTSFHSVIDFIIQLLGTAGEIEDCELLSRSMRSKNPKTRSQVVEALEKTCEPPIFRLLQPLVDDLPREEKLRAYDKGGRPAIDLNELLDKMSRSSARADRIISIALKHYLHLPNWKNTVKQLMAEGDEIFYTLGYELLET